MLIILRTFYHEQLSPSSDIDLFIWGLDEPAAIEKVRQIESSIRNVIREEVTVRQIRLPNTSRAEDTARSFGLETLLLLPPNTPFVTSRPYYDCTSRFRRFSPVSMWIAPALSMMAIKFMAHPGGSWLFARTTGLVRLLVLENYRSQKIVTTIMYRGDKNKGDHQFMVRSVAGKERGIVSKLKNRSVLQSGVTKTSFWTTKRSPSLMVRVIMPETIEKVLFAQDLQLNSGTC